MCEANVYLIKEDIEELIMESVDKLMPTANEIMLQDIFGAKKTLKAEIDSMALVDHKILLRAK